MNLSLSGKVALITGGSRGIGAAAVRMFVAAGAHVFFSYEKAKQQAEQLIKELGADNCAASRVQSFRHRYGPRFSGRAQLRASDGSIFLSPITAYGLPADVSIDQMDDAQWRSTVAINLDSVFALIKHSVLQMKQQKRSGGAAGHIVLVSSTAGQRGEAFHCDYAATKGALISMVKGLSTELAPDGIHVNCVAPGWVDTDMSAAALKDSKSRAAIFATIPLGRVAKPEEIAAPILFLCTPEAGFITGEVFNVNGGAVLVG